MMMIIITRIARTINIPKRHIHPARRTARASNPMQAKQTQVRIVRQMQVRQITVRMVKPHIAAAQDSNPIPVRQDKQLRQGNHRGGCDTGYSREDSA